MEKTNAQVIITDKFTQRDIDHSVKRHTEIFTEEYGFSQIFNDSVSQLVADFGKNFNPENEFMLVARVDGEFGGTISCICQPDGQARLRYFFVEPFTRGHGVGRKLFTTAMEKAKEMGSTHAYFTTYNVLEPARNMYRSLGFEITHTEPDEEVAPGVIEETWERDL